MPQFLHDALWVNLHFPLTGTSKSSQVYIRYYPHGDQDVRGFITDRPIA